MATDTLFHALERLAWLVERLLAIALLIAVLLNVVNVVSRYVFGEAITSADELQIYLMVALAFLGALVASARRSHLRMDVLVRYFPATLARALVVAEGVLTVVLCAFAAWVSGQYVMKMYQLGSISENGHFPMWVPHSLLAVAFVLMTLVGVVWALRPSRPTSAPDEGVAS